MMSIQTISIICSLILWNQCSSHLVSRGIDTEDESVVEKLKVAKLSDSEDELNLLQFSMFGKPYSFKLTPANSIFSPNFKILQRQIDYQIDRQNRKKSKLLEGSFYNDNNGRGSFYIQHKNGEIQLNGFVDDTFVISYSQGRHIARKTFEKKSQIDRILNYKTSSKPISSKNKLQDEVATVEVLVFLDPTVHKNLVERDTDMKQYLGIFWNTVQNKYKIFSNPKIRFSLSGVVVLPDMDWVGDIFLAPNKPTDGLILKSFGEWMYKEKQDKTNKFPHYDAAVLHTAMDLSFEDDEGTINDGTLGIAPLAEVCGVDTEEEVLKSICVLEDFNAPTFSAAMIAIHEIGHLLGAVHDNPDDCDIRAIMLPSMEHVSPSVRVFCNTSIEQIQTHLNSEAAACIFDSPQPHIPLGPEQPSMDRDDICKKAYGDNFNAIPLDNYSEAADPCIYVLCLINDESEDPRAFMWVPEGTPCGDDEQVCIKGKCIVH